MALAKTLPFLSNIPLMQIIASLTTYNTFRSSDSREETSHTFKATQQIE
jgi:hypothetical protein